MRHCGPALEPGSQPCEPPENEYLLFELNKSWRHNDGQVASESQQRSTEQVQRDIYETHRHRVFSLSYYMTANEIEAETMLEGTFIHAFRHSPTPDAQGVDNALLRQLEERFVLSHETPATPDPGSLLARGNVRRTDLEESLHELPPRERLVFLLHDVESYPPARIASLLGSEEPQVFKTLISARIRMRNALAVARAAVAAVAEQQDTASDASEQSVPDAERSGGREQGGTPQGPAYPSADA
jgi:DNA-directed RNA polymerase specialized sigma24 family protein